VFVNFQIFEISIPSLHFINSYLNFFFLLYQIFKAKLHISEHSNNIARTFLLASTCCLCAQEIWQRKKHLAKRWLHWDHLYFYSRKKSFRDRRSRYSDITARFLRQLTNCLSYIHQEGIVIKIFSPRIFWCIGNSFVVSLANSNRGKIEKAE